MTEPALTVHQPDLKALAVAVLGCWGTPPVIADLTAEPMIRTDLCGVDSRGVGMLRRYREWHAAGDIVPAAEPKVVGDEGPTGVVDRPPGARPPPVVPARVPRRARPIRERGWQNAKPAR
jgi:LDH2 family malate/lactate/ureidoglycolate dehydrogenase